MANIPELVQWEAGVYQFETTDPVQGGVNGVDNLPHRQISNRTLFIKARQDAVATQVGLTPSNTDQQLLVACAILHVATQSAIRALPIPQVASPRTVVVVARGGSVDGDGGGGTYRWSSTATGADNAPHVLLPSSAPAQGRWLLMVDNPLAINAGLFNGQTESFYRNASNLNSGTVPTARLGSGTADATTFLRGDQTWSTVNAVTLNGQPASFYQNASNINAGTLAPARMGAGAPGATVYLRGDGVWAAVNAGTLEGQAAAFYRNASNLNAGTVPTARMGSGTANGSTYLRGDNVWSQVDAVTLGGIGPGSFFNASNLNAGSVPDARVPLSAVSQHAGSIKARNFPGRGGTSVTLLSGSGPPSLAGSVDGDVFEYY